MIVNIYFKIGWADRLMAVWWSCVCFWQTAVVYMPSLMESAASSTKQPQVTANLINSETGRYEMEKNNKCKPRSASYYRQHWRPAKPAQEIFISPVIPPPPPTISFWCITVTSAKIVFSVKPGMMANIISCAISSRCLVLWDINSKLKTSTPPSLCPHPSSSYGLSIFSWFGRFLFPECRLLLKKEGLCDQLFYRLIDYSASICFPFLPLIFNSAVSSRVFWGGISFVALSWNAYELNCIESKTTRGKIDLAQNTF